MSQPNSTPARGHFASALSILWWLVLLRGVLLLIVGGYLLFRPARPWSC